ncbi:MAG: metal ABC transporter permease [Epsilonproteobacteria bacterium]|nr:hypothetical protein [Campylobacterota bacterium]NPA57500.1 metal ABC transporter permease [Campylobacterota bacterium]
MSEFFTLFAPSLIAALLLSLLIAIAGSLMLLGRYSYIAAAIAHGSYGGVGLALLLGLPILLGTTLFALLLALLLAYITYRSPQRSDLLIGTIWAVGMSLGILFIDLTPGYRSDLLGYLFGNILLLESGDLLFLAVVDLLLIAALLLYRHHFLALAYDRDFAQVRGIRVGRIHTLTILLLALSVVASIRAVGLILVIALLSIPPFIAERLSRNFLEMVFLAALLALLFTGTGLFLSYWFDLPATATIILTAAVGFMLFTIGRR